MLARLRQVRLLYRKHFADCKKKRQFVSLASFFTAFATVRVITHSIRAGIGPFRNITPGGRHIHHMTFGIIGLLMVGYLWMMEIGTATTRRLSSRMTSGFYGAGAALTLDEFALWLNLQDVYWERQGRSSVDAALIFVSLLSAGVWGGPFLAAVGRVVLRGRRVS